MRDFGLALLIATAVFAGFFPLLINAAGQSCSIADIESESDLILQFYVDLAAASSSGDFQAIRRLCSEPRRILLCKNQYFDFFQHANHLEILSTSPRYKISQDFSFIDYIREGEDSFEPNGANLKKLKQVRKRLGISRGNLEMQLQKILKVFNIVIDAWNDELNVNFFPRVLPAPRNRLVKRSQEQTDPVILAVWHSIQKMLSTIAGAFVSLAGIVLFVVAAAIGLPVWLGSCLSRLVVHGFMQISAATISAADCCTCCCSLFDCKCGWSCGAMKSLKKGLRSCTGCIKETADTALVFLFGIPATVLNFGIKLMGANPFDKQVITGKIKVDFVDQWLELKDAQPEGPRIPVKETNESAPPANFPPEQDLEHSPVHADGLQNDFLTQPQTAPVHEGLQIRTPPR